MFKKFLALSLAIILSSSVIACGEKTEEKNTQNDINNKIESDSNNSSSNDATTIFDSQLQDPTQTFEIIVEGQSYNLADDYETTLANMAKNGIEVRTVRGTSMMLYDENGEVYKPESFDNNNPNFSFTPDHMPLKGDMIKYNELRKEKGDLLRDDYVMYGTNINFELSNGIQSSSSLDELKSLDGYIERSAIINRKNYSYCAVYVNGEPLDFSNYEDQYNAWAESVNTDGLSAATAKHFPDLYYSHSIFWDNSNFSSCKSIDDVEATCVENNFLYKADILFACAMMDAGKMLEEGTIDSYSTVCLEDLDGEGILMRYSKTYYKKHSESK